MFLRYFVAGASGLLISAMGLYFSLLGGPTALYLVGTLLLLSYVGVIVYIVIQVKLGNGHGAAISLLSPMFITTGALILFGLGARAFNLMVPDSKQFLDECKSSGARYFKLPTSPVNSVAFDWNTKEHPPFDQFEVLFGTRISSLGRWAFQAGESIEYVERKRSNLEGHPSHGPDGPYIRFPKTGKYFAVTDVTADVLVHYEILPEEELRKAENDQGIVSYEVTVTDRRTQEKLAILKYVLDVKKMRGCGLTGEKTMSVRSFVGKVIGLD